MNTVTQKKQVVFALCNKKTIALSQEFTVIHERSNELINIKQFIDSCTMRVSYVRTMGFVLMRNSNELEYRIRYF